jgi:hypothetical protein
MELVKAIEIVKSLADGLDPTSHQPLISESVYQNTDTARALYTAVQVLEESRQREERKAQLPPKLAGLGTTRKTSNYATNFIAPLPSMKWLKCTAGPAAPSSRGW